MEPAFEFALELMVDIAPTETVGATPTGLRRRVAITGGTFEGPAIRGEVVPGGADTQLVRADGMVEVTADYLIRAEDGTLIRVLNRGLASRTYAWTAPVFEAPTGPHDWLNRFTFVSSLEKVGEQVRVRVFKLDTAEA